MIDDNKYHKLDCILLVDDDPSINFLHRRIIERAQVAHRVRNAINGQEALDLLTTLNAASDVCSIPKLILLDINMPVMNGWEFLDAYEQHPVFDPSVVIVVISTALPPPTEQEAAKQRKSTLEFLEKPLKTKDLLELMHLHFGPS